MIHIVDLKYGGTLQLCLSIPGEFITFQHKGELKILIISIPSCLRLSHLWSNVIFQLILGVLLEIVHHWKRIAIIYLSSILGGSLFITVLSPQTYAVGASAGVYGLLFSHLSTIIINWNEMDRKACRLFWLLAYLTFDIGLSVLNEFYVKKDSNVTFVSIIPHID